MEIFAVTTFARVLLFHYHYLKAMAISSMGLIAVETEILPNIYMLTLQVLRGYRVYLHIESPNGQRKSAQFYKLVL